MIMYYNNLEGLFWQLQMQIALRCTSNCHAPALAHFSNPVMLRLQGVIGKLHLNSLANG